MPHLHTSHRCKFILLTPVYLRYRDTNLSYWFVPHEYEVRYYLLELVRARTLFTCHALRLCDEGEGRISNEPTTNGVSLESEALCNKYYTIGADNLTIVEGHRNDFIVYEEFSGRKKWPTIDFNRLKYLIARGYITIDFTIDGWPIAMMHNAAINVYPPKQYSDRQL